MATAPFAHLRLVCLNIDGVLLPDSFSPVIHRVLTKHGVEYTSELERLILSQPRMVAGSILASATRQPWTWQEAVDEYFVERAAYLADHPIAVSPGLDGLLDRLAPKGTPLVCYGGLDQAHFDEHLGAYAGRFTEYISTNDVRPGIKEIVGRFGLRYDQVLFVDDVNRFAEFAKHLGVAFTGMPSPFGFQREHMGLTGVRHIVGGLDEITGELLDRLDAESAAGVVWQ
jgi:phosphoglycolate phosphatase-like HAD superfamily hydrolase